MKRRSQPISKRSVAPAQARSLSWKPVPVWVFLTPSRKKPWSSPSPRGLLGKAAVQRNRLRNTTKSGQCSTATIILDLAKQWSNHLRFGEAVELCRKHGVHVGCFNPCFELWLILHERDCNKPNSSRKMQAELNAVDWFRTIAVLRFDGVQSQLVDQPILDHGRVRARVRIAVEGNTVIQCDLFPYSAQGSYHHSCRPGCAAREVMLMGQRGAFRGASIRQLAAVDRRKSTGLEETVSAKACCYDQRGSECVVARDIECCSRSADSMTEHQVSRAVQARYGDDRHSQRSP